MEVEGRAFRVLVPRFRECSLLVHADGGRGLVWWHNLVSNACGVGTVVGS